jgi:hypothetical protein
VKTLFQIGGKLLILVLVAHQNPRRILAYEPNFTGNRQFGLPVGTSFAGRTESAFSYAAPAAYPTPEAAAAAYDR